MVKKIVAKNKKPRTCLPLPGLLKVGINNRLVINQKLRQLNEIECCLHFKAAYKPPSFSPVIIY